MGHMYSRLKLCLVGGETGNGLGIPVFERMYLHGYNTRGGTDKQGL